MDRASVGEQLCISKVNSLPRRDEDDEADEAVLYKGLRVLANSDSGDNPPPS